MVSAVDLRLRNRGIAGIALFAVLAIGVWVSGAAERESRARVAQLRTGEVPADQAQTEALNRALRFTQGEGYFEAEFLADLKTAGLTSITLEELRQPNRFLSLIEAPQRLPAGSSWSGEGLRLRASIEKVTFQQHGASVAARHAVLTVTNIGSRPLGYFVRAVSADRGTCAIRGARQHNAMALLPGENAEIVVCAGEGDLVVQELKALEVTPIGYVYLSKVPPIAVGHDPITSRAHRPLNRVSLCTNVPAASIANLLKAGDARWEDVADFYSRHNCERFQFPSGYRRAIQPLAMFPAQAAEPRPSDG